MKKINIIWIIFTAGWLLTGITFLILGEKEIGILWIAMAGGSLFGYLTP